jgi:alpha-beta hydrolase superfamily lysophospholipase
MSIHGNVVLCLVLGALSLNACQDQTSQDAIPTPTEPNLAKGAVNPVGHVQGDPRPHCHETTVPVALAAGQAVQYTIYGQLCLPPGSNPHRVQTVHLAVHGATYSHLYNAWPFEPGTYSYADALMKAGYAVFTFDRIGIGRSSHPAGASVTIDANAFVVHQLVQGLRSGSIGTAFQRVVLVGHSLGSITSLAEASAFGDVDGVVLTGISHAVTTSAANALQLVKANQDPRFAGQNLDDDYLTTAPGTRGTAFYYLPVTDPRVLALDEATKETFTTAELATIGPALAPATSLAIHVPVLIVDGQFDQLVCGDGFAICVSGAALATAEVPFFAPEACLQTVVTPQSGHDLYLEPSAPSTYAAIRAWSDAYVGLDAAAPSCTHS